MSAMGRTSSLTRTARRFGVQGSLLLAAAAAAALTPLYAYFAGEGPPLWRGSALVASAVSLLLLLDRMSRLDRVPPPFGRALVSFLAGAALLGGYQVGLGRWSVPPPDARAGARVQTGFATRDWSLTPEASAFLREEGPEMRASEELMLAFGAYPDGAQRIWKDWTILGAGSLLILFHVLGFAGLTAGLVGLAGARSRSLATSAGAFAWENARAKAGPAASSAPGAAPAPRLVVVVPAILGSVRDWQPLLTRLSQEPSSPAPAGCPGITAGASPRGNRWSISPCRCARA